jgi:hypothetical protein
MRRHPFEVLHSNFRLPCANLLKPEQLEENPALSVAVEQPEVRAGELVDSEARLLVSAAVSGDGEGQRGVPRLALWAGGIFTLGYLRTSLGVIENELFIL